MSVDRRNPYVILGIPFGADEDAARAGFARASRRVRASSDAPFSMEDLTWALHQVEQMIEEPERAFGVYRIPADAALADLEPPGVFSPQPEPMPRATPPSTANEWRGIRQRAAIGVLRAALAAQPLHLQVDPPHQPKEQAHDS